MPAPALRPRARRNPVGAVAWSFAAASVAGLGLIGCGMPADGESRRDEENRVIPVVEAVQARFGSLPLEERVTGVVRARNQVAIQAEITAPVVEVLVRSGEAVQRGQPLVRLDDRTLRDQLRQAEANVRLTQASARESRARVAELQAQVVRSRTLAAQELISDLELETQEAQLLAGEASADQADARVEQAEAVVQERQTALQRTLVRAPVSGTVGQRQAEVGMLVDSGSVLFLIGDLEDLMVEVPLTEEMLGYLRVGQQVRIQTDARSDAPIGAELSRISPFLEAGSFSTVGEIDVRNTGGRLSPGMFVAVDVLYGESEHATLVPTAAIWEDPRSGLRGVWIVQSMPTVATPTGDAAQSDVRPVELRAIEVLAEGRLSVGLRGVEQDEWVVTVGQHLLHADEGARVRAVTWDQVLGLQALQREDLLHRFLEKQQEVARETGAAPVVRPLYETRTSPPAPAQRVPESTF